MERLRLTFADPRTGTKHELRVPNIATALIVADINLDRGLAELAVGERVLARLERQGRDHAPFWQVS